jgi:NAD(P)-dependent dehydrogenase (short-subunit alcohol dehydrogenase family)
MAGKLTGKVAVITGAGSEVGIGKETAKAMAIEGAKVVVNDIVKDPSGSMGADRVVNEIKEAGGIAVANYDSVASMEGGRNIIKAAIDNFGKIDILVNTAGNHIGKPTMDYTEQDWDAILGVHLKGLFACTQAALKYMIPQKTGGRIINFTSIGVCSPELDPYASIAYNTAKAAVLGFTRTTSIELNQYGITVNAISPRATTILCPACIRNGVEIKDFGPEYVAPIVIYLASDEAKEITSQVIMSGGNEIIFYAPIMQTPGAHQWFHKTGKWTIDELSQVIPKVTTKF